MTLFKPTGPNSRSYRFIARSACVIALAIGAASLATAIPAQAKNNKHGQGEAHCPPGLAKKSVPCVPPGQVKSSNHGWQSGDYFDEDEAHWITRPDLYDLRPLPAGQRYVVIGNRIYVVNESSYQIMSVLNAVSAILD
ncbi:MAG TPA: hypothetical protein PK450_06300 [Paracoccaceae bacterium]|nr:hypothetical protein [Paracoccaceae bacterium]